jgi:hypothetical protein
MKKFMVLYMASPADFEKAMKASPDQHKKGMDAWMKWTGKHKKTLVDDGAPLGKPSVSTPKVPQTQRTALVVIRSCKRNRMTRPRRCSARTIPTCR